MATHKDCLAGGLEGSTWSYARSSWPASQKLNKLVHEGGGDVRGDGSPAHRPCISPPGLAVFCPHVGGAVSHFVSPSPLIPKKTGCVFPQVYSPSCLIPSEVDAEKLSGVKFHQSCPYRGAGMGAVKKPFFLQGISMCWIPRFRVRLPRGEAHEGTRCCMHLDRGAAANWASNHCLAGKPAAQRNKTLDDLTPGLPRHRGVQSMGVRARPVAMCAQLRCWLKPRSACGT